MPYPRAKAIDQIPAICPPPFPAGLTFIGAWQEQAYQMSKMPGYKNEVSMMI